MPNQKMTLSTIRGGMLEEWFQRELAKVVANIRDPNTPQAKSRTLTVKLTFKATEDRQLAAVTCDVSSGLAGRKPLQTFTLFDYEGEQLVALEQVAARGGDPRQGELAGVRPIRAPKTAEETD